MARTCDLPRATQLTFSDFVRVDKMNENVITDLFWYIPR